MNKDQIKGAVKEATGKVQAKVGKVTGNNEQRAKGLLHEAEGKTQKHVGNAKEVVKDAIDRA
jgi:uncharacterized protein YjbJ (UPF0337 family)